MKRSLIILLLSLFCGSALWAYTQQEISHLEAEMQKYFDTKERSAFFRTTDKLKDAYEESGEKRLYYKVWSNEGIYEAKQQNYTAALKIAQKILDDAREKGSTYGEYAASHTKAMILLQKQDYEAAEKAFLEAVDFHRRHFSSESAGEDLIELMYLAIRRRDMDKSIHYARQVVNEPNVIPMQKGRALYRLSLMAFNLNDTVEYNHIYNSIMLLKEEEGVSPLIPLVEVNHAIINGDYDTALRLSEGLDEENRAERKAFIYHCMGDDAKAYSYMQMYKSISDSLMLLSHDNVVAGLHDQMENDRAQMEQSQQEKEHNRLLNRIFFALVALIVLILLSFIWRSRKIVKMLRLDNMQLVYERKDAERALTDLNELSFFESKEELPLTLAFKPNEVCDHLAASTQARCHKGVAMLFQTELADDFEFHTNSEALKQLLVHLLNYSARFTYNGTIKLSCSDTGENIRFAVSDTSAGLGGDSKNHVIGMFSEQDNKIRYVGMNFNICQSITRLLHGRIWHDTAYTNGTQFCFEIPKEPKAA